MNLDEAAKRLGYFDANHVEMNIKACGKPSVEWWGLIKELVENNSVLDDVSERYLLIEWLDSNPMIDGSIYFDSKEDCLTYWEKLPKTKLFDITHTICRITNVR